MMAQCTLIVTTVFWSARLKVVLDSNPSHLGITVTAGQLTGLARYFMVR